MGGIVFFSLLYICSKSHNDGMICVFLVTSLVANITYLLSYYLPYMLFAFIYDPLQASVTYLGLAAYIEIFYVFFCALESNINPKRILKIFLYFPCDSTYKLKQCVGKIPQKRKVLDIIRIFLVTAVIAFFSMLFFYMVTWGSFDDLKVAQHVSLPLVLLAVIRFIFYYTKVDTVDTDNN